MSTTPETPPAAPPAPVSAETLAAPVKAPLDPIVAKLYALREPFDDKHISWLPKPTKQQNDESTKGQWIRCNVCGGWHHPQVVHLEYVGHAAATNRLLEVDPFWNWEPLVFDERGLPRFDGTGGLWIKLTVCGVTRLGYGHANEKSGADKGAREKEVIGDAIRNAAMRFGLALDLWHKGQDEFYSAPATDNSQAGGAQERKDGEAPRNAEGKPELPEYPADQFKANLPAWRKAIADGKATVDSVIKKVGTRYTLTDKQKSDLRASPAPAVTPPNKPTTRK